MSVLCVTLMNLLSLIPQTSKQSLEHTMIILSLKGKDLKSFLVESKHGEATVGFSQRGGNRKVSLTQPNLSIFFSWVNGERTNNMRR